MEYLDYSEIMKRKRLVQVEFESLMEIPFFVVRQNSLQWQFFRACMAQLLEPKSGELALFADITRRRAAQYKFEVEYKLRQLYLNPGKKHDFVFSLSHIKDLPCYGLSPSHYPCYAGYCVLVRDTSNETGAFGGDRRELLDYLEKIVSDAVAAEFNTYCLLPEVNFSALSPYFEKDSPAMKEIMTVVNGLAVRRWHLNNPMNPSTYRILSIKTKKLFNNEAEIATNEYWYLRWWDECKGKFAYPYRETNRQLYILRYVSDTWRIYQNIKPKPRSDIIKKFH